MIQNIKDLWFLIHFPLKELRRLVEIKTFEQDMEMARRMKNLVDEIDNISDYLQEDAWSRLKTHLTINKPSQE